MYYMVSGVGHVDIRHNTDPGHVGMCVIKQASAPCLVLCTFKIIIGLLYKSKRKILKLSMQKIINNVKN